ncbi:MAG: hypothetical protein QXZ31_10575 [Thermofilaceae archaeon]
MLREAIIECSIVSARLERGAPPDELLEHLTSLIVYLEELLGSGGLKEYLAEEVRSTLGVLRRSRDEIRERRAEALRRARESVLICRGVLRALLGPKKVNEIEIYLIDLRERLRSRSLTYSDVLDRFSEAVSRMRKLHGASEALEKLETLYEYFSNLRGELRETDRENAIRAINDVILSLEKSLPDISENFRRAKPESMPVKVAVRGEVLTVRTPFFLGRDPSSQRLCIRSAEQFFEVEVELVTSRSEELRVEADLFPKVYTFSSEVAQGVSRLQAYVYAARGRMYLAATGRRPMRIVRGDGTVTNTKGGYSGEIVELGTWARIEIEGAPRIELAATDAV